MALTNDPADTMSFLKSLGFPELRVHHSLNHFDFIRPSRRILVIGPMGSGKTEYSSRIWRDAQVALKKSSLVAARSTTAGADRRTVFFVRSLLDAQRFPEYPDDALAYRGGYVRCGRRIARISSSFDLEDLLADNPDAGTWVIDEASFYDERLAYVVRHESLDRGLVFIFATLVLNFRREVFNATARLLLETATDVFPLTAYCEHPDCLADSFYTYRYYKVDGVECPALYFDPLIVIGGDREHKDPRRPNYCTRCDAHHYLPGKEYTYFILKPLGESASRGNPSPLRSELEALKRGGSGSQLHELFRNRYEKRPDEAVNMNALRVPFIAEKALVYLYAEANLLSESGLRALVEDVGLERDYIDRTLAENGRPVHFSE